MDARPWNSGRITIPNICVTRTMLIMIPTNTAHCPQVKIKAVMPEIGDEDTSITGKVTLKLSRPLLQVDNPATTDVDERERYCYRGGSRPPKTEPLMSRALRAG